MSLLFFLAGTASWFAFGFLGFVIVADDRITAAVARQ
jgi:hypothetical protein